MLIDRCVIEVRSGKGGDGAISFLQDKNTQRGGPDGGNGGRGGSIYLIGKKNINTLYNFRHSRVIIAGDGGKGEKKNRYGQNADDVIVEVPAGTLVIDEKSGRVLFDVKEENQKVLVAKGGRGGRGNACFKSSRHRIPRIAENGHPGEKKRLILELKMLADAGLIGFPSVGKSTLLNVLTRAKSATGDYPFTTLEPNLGVAYLPDGRSFVLADMPGLIEGASEGKGLGTRFLRHIERTRVLIHLVSMDGRRDPYQDYLALNAELVKYGAMLEKRPQIVVSSKLDEEGALERKAAFDAKLGFASLGLSSFTREGVAELLTKAMNLIDATPFFPLKSEIEGEDIRIYDAHEEAERKCVKIVPEKPHYWRILGEEAEQKAALINTSTDEGIERLIAYLNELKIDDFLVDAGVREGDTVLINDFAFVYSE